MTMNAISADREERRRAQKELADQLKMSGALDEIFAKIDAGTPLTGDGGLLGGMLKAALERGLDAELTEHLGYDRGDPAASAFDNSRNGTTPKTIATEVGDLELAVPRDRNGTFTPMLVPKGQRRLDGLDGMIISLYAGGMTIRDIQHHLLSTLGTELSHETISKITDQVADEVLAWQTRPLEAWRVERPALPFGHPVQHLVGDRRDRGLRHLGAVHVRPGARRCRHGSSLAPTTTTRCPRSNPADAAASP